MSEPKQEREKELVCGCTFTNVGNLRFCDTHRMALEFRKFIERNLRTFTPPVAAQASQLLGGETLAVSQKVEVVARGCGCNTEWRNGTIIKTTACKEHEAIGA